MKNKVTEFIRSREEEIISRVTELIQIPSVDGEPLPGHPFGREVGRALDYTLNLCSDLGFVVKNMDGHFGYAEWGEGSELMGVLAHIDVVPSGDENEWEFPPFEGRLSDGFLQGRGAQDDKGPLISSIYGMYALKELGFVPDKRIRILIGTNEEKGCEGVKYYLKNDEHPDISFSPDGMFTVVNREKGISVLNLKMKGSSTGVRFSGGTAHNLVPGSAEAFIPNNLVRMTTFEQTKKELESNSDDGTSFSFSESPEGITIRSAGKTAHAMNPEKGLNAVTNLAEFLLVYKDKADIDLGETGSFLSLLLKKIGKDTSGKEAGIACEDDVSGALTLNVGILRADEAGCFCQLDIRSPVTADCNIIVENIEENFKDTGIQLEIEEIKAPLYVPDNTQLVQTLCGVYEKVTGKEAVLYSIGGGTYARYLDNCVCFGSVYPDEKLTVHMPNEQVEADNISKNAVMYALAIYKLAGGE